MKKALKELYYYDGKVKKIGIHQGLQGNCSGLFGDCSRLTGDCTGVYGNCTDLEGNFDDAEITEEERKIGINIESLIKDDSI